MGQIFSQLTQPGSALQDPNTGRTMAIGSASQVLNSTGPLVGQAMGQGMGNVMSGTPPAPGSAPQNGQLPRIGTPSFQEAATEGALPGGANALSPGLSKAGKLVTLLTGGLQGALAGRAAQEQAAVQSGGRRAGGAGIAMEAGYALPWQRAQQQAELEQRQAQTGLLQAEQQTVNVPGFGPMPTWLARTVAPAYFRQQGQLGAAQIGAGSRVQGAEIGAGARVQAAQIGQRFKAVPGMGLYDTQARQIIPGTAQSVTITPEIAQDYGLPQDFIGKPMNVQQLSSIERAQNQQTTVTQGAAGPALVNKRTAQTTPLGLGSPGVAVAMARPVQVAPDVNNPGAITYAPAGQAMQQQMQAPGSATTQAAKSTLRSATSGPIGNEINAFNTAIQHSQLLRTAATALQNGDQNTLNGLKNSFKNEFGSTGPVTAQVIADAYTREINKMLSSGHITDSEIGAIGKTLNVNRQSLPQTLGVLNAYEALARSKMQMRQQQVQQGMRGQPNFPAQRQNDPLGIRP